MTNGPPITRYLLVWFSPETIKPQSLVPIRRMVEDSVVEEPQQVEVDVWLESPGGDAHTAFKLALLLRYVAVKIRIIVPDYAKSAATLLALAGHEIYLAPAAELGPLDAQLHEEGKGYISALSIARAADEVARDAVALAGRGGADLLLQTGLTRAETLDAMLRFSASFSEPLVRQLDPKSVHHAKQMLRVTMKYAENLLSATMPLGTAMHMAVHLVEDFPSHGFVISYQDAKNLDLPVRPISEYDMLKELREWHRGFEDGDSIICFGRLSDLLGHGEEEDEDDKEEETSGNKHQDVSREEIEASIQEVTSQLEPVPPRSSNK